jgi:hypothetical protein
MINHYGIKFNTLIKSIKMRAIVSAIVIFFSHSLVAQKIENIIVEQDNNFVNILYDLSGTNSIQPYKVTISGSINNGNRFVLQNVNGDVGDYIYSGKHKKITWDVFKDVETIDEVQFFIRAEPMNISNPDRRADDSKNKVVEYMVGYNASITDYLGIKLGTLSKWGGYISIKTGGFLDYSFLAGVNKSVLKHNIFVYSGLGAGNWGWLNGDIDFWTNHIGLEYEFGILAKFNRLYINIGPTFLYGNSDNNVMDISFGIGYTIGHK